MKLTVFKMVNKMRNLQITLNIPHGFIFEIPLIEFHWHDEVGNYKDKN